jgi:hypothetical protein
MRGTDIPTALVAAAWGYLLLAGIDLLLGVRAQHVPGYPAPGQLFLLAGLPALFLLLLAGAIILSRKARWFYYVYPFVTGLIGFLILPVLMFWGGGV